MITSKIEADNTFINEIKKTQAKNKNCQKWFDKQSNEFIIHEKILHFQKLIYTPINLKQKMIEQHHDLKIYEHSKVEKIMKHIQKNYYFSEIKKLIKKYIAVCVKCNQNKTSRHKSYEKMRTFQISKQV